MKIMNRTICACHERFFRSWLMMGVFALCLWVPTPVFAAGTVNIYSHRQQVLIHPFLDTFTKATGVETKTFCARICTRLGSHVYIRVLLASLISAHGTDAAESWARDYVSNLARKPLGNDRAPAKAISQGICYIAIMNSYYYGNMKFSDDADQRLWADSLRLVFTNQQDRGNHINISGAGVAKYSPNKKDAQAFLEFLTNEVAQQLYGTINYEYPVNPAVAPSAELASWGVFERDELPMKRLAELAPEAQMIIDRVGW